MSHAWCFFFAISSRRNLSLASLLFNSVAGRRTVLERGRQGRQEAAGKKPQVTATGRYFKPELSQNLINSFLFCQWPPINSIFRHVVVEFGLHSSNFFREKRSSSPPGRFQTMICSKVSNQRNSKYVVHFISANQRFVLGRVGYLKRNVHEALIVNSPEKGFYGSKWHQVPNSNYTTQTEGGLPVVQWLIYHGANPV